MISITQRPFTRQEYPEGWARLDAERRALYGRSVRCAVPALLGLALAVWFALQRPAFFWGREVSIGLACMFGAGAVMLAAESVRCVSKGVRSKLDLNAAAAQGADFMEIVELEASRAWDCGDAHGSAMLFEVGPDTHVWVWTDEWLDHIPLDCPSSEREVHARWRFEVRGDYIWSLIPVPGPSIRLIEATDDLNSSTEVEWSFRVFRRAELPSPLARIVGDAAPTAPRRATGGS